jgi:hypothetical protein
MIRSLRTLLVVGVPIGAFAFACGSNGSSGEAGGSDASVGDAAGDGSFAGDTGSDAGGGGDALGDAETAMCSDYNPSKNVYWGDLHTHTALSADAYGWGNRNFPHDAHRFASTPSATTPIAAGAPTPGPLV